MSGDSSDRSLAARDVEAWLETIATTRDTLIDSLEATLVPSPSARPEQTNSGQRALALVRELSSLSPTSPEQLEQGAVIAQGGMGVIRAGFQVGLGRAVAVKTLRPDRPGTVGAIDLLREAWITGAVDHPNVVPVHYVGMDAAGQPVIVLKHVDGVVWSELISDAGEVQRRFGASDLLAWNLGILLQLLNALRFAHARGIIHRDLKPANVMIGEFGEVYLLDWGIAVSMRADALGRLPLAADATQMAGTPMYMAPEMLGRGGPPISERTDVYLAGAVLFELIAGHPPHTGSSVLEVMTNVVLSQPAFPADAPGELARICKRAMEADPAARFASVEELRAALVAYLEHRGSARLAEVANQRLARLLELLAATATPAHANDEIYRLFGACRFGFHEALAAWRDNTDATEGLVRATSAVAAHELTAGDPRAAVALLSELTEPPAELLARARRAVAEEAVRHGEAEHLRRQHDVAIGTRTRTLIMAVMGTLFTVMPLATAVGLIAAPTHLTWALSSLVFFGIVLGFGIWARESLMATVLNRRSFMTIEAAMLAHVLIAATTWRLGLSIVDSEVLIVLVWVIISGVAAIAIDSRLAVGALAYTISFALVLWMPDRRQYFMSAGNLGFALSAVYHWRPTRWRRS